MHVTRLINHSEGRPADRCEALFLQADYNECLAELDKLAKAGLLYQRTRAHLLRGHIAVRMNRADEAVGHYLRAATERRDSDNVLVGYAFAAVAATRAGRADDSTKYMVAARARVPKGKAAQADIGYAEMAIAFMRGDMPAARDAIIPAMRTPDVNARARARIIFAALEGAEGRLEGQATILSDVLQKLRRASTPDVYLQANALHSFAALARELPIHTGFEPALDDLKTLAWTPHLLNEQYHCLRALGWRQAIEGDAISGIHALRASLRYAPNNGWRAMSHLDCARIATAVDNHVFAEVEMREATGTLEQVVWDDNVTEERFALLGVAEALASKNLVAAQRFLSRYANLRPLRADFHLAHDERAIAMFEQVAGTLAYAEGQSNAAISSWSRAHEIFERYGYIWRAGVIAQSLYAATNEPRWLRGVQRLRQSYPRSWMAGKSEPKQARIDDPIYSKLTPTQRRVLALFARGLSGPEVAKEMGVVPNTIYQHANAIHRAFGVHTTTQAVSEARNRGLIK